MVNPLSSPTLEAFENPHLKSPIVDIPIKRWPISRPKIPIIYCLIHLIVTQVLSFFAAYHHSITIKFPWSIFNPPYFPAFFRISPHFHPFSLELLSPNLNPLPDHGPTTSGPDDFNGLRLLLRAPLLDGLRAAGQHRGGAPSGARDFGRKPRRCGLLGNEKGPTLLENGWKWWLSKLKISEMVISPATMVVEPWNKKRFYQQSRRFQQQKMGIWQRKMVWIYDDICGYTVCVYIYIYTYIQLNTGVSLVRMGCIVGIWRRIDGMSMFNQHWPRKTCFFSATKMVFFFKLGTKPLRTMEIFLDVWCLERFPWNWSSWKWSIFPWFWGVFYRFIMGISWDVSIKQAGAKHFNGILNELL